MTNEKLAEIKNGFETAYVDRTVSSNLAYKPQFVSNNHKEGKKVVIFTMILESGQVKLLKL